MPLVATLPKMQGTGAPKSGVICGWELADTLLNSSINYGVLTAQDLLLTPPQVLPGQVAMLNSPVLPNGNEMAGRSKCPK